MTKSAPPIFEFKIPVQHVDFVKFLAFERDKIVQIFGIPPGMLRYPRYATPPKVMVDAE